MSKELHIDIETYSDVEIKLGVHKYSESLAFSIDIFAYAFNDDPVTVIDLAQGEKIPVKVMRAIKNPKVKKYAHNAMFERVCIGKYLFDGMPLDPTNWHCTMVWGSCLGLPQSLDNMSAALGNVELKDKEGKRLIQYFAKPCKPTKVNGGRTRNLPEHAPEDWKKYKKYCKQDVKTERGIHRTLSEIYELPLNEWQGYWNDQRINDTGVPLDIVFVKQAIKYKNKLKERSSRKLRRLTGVEKVTQLAQLKAWATEQGYPIKSLGAEAAADMLADQELDQDFPEVYKMVKLYTEAGGTAVAKYDTMLARVCEDGTVKGELKFCGAGATGRWAGTGCQVQNMPRVYLKKEDLEEARNYVLVGAIRKLKKFGNPIDVLTQLVRTAIMPPDGYEFGVSDYSAIEARVNAWLAGEQWVLQAFREGKDIYVATAQNMYHVDYETAKRDLRQNGKTANLALGYGGGVGALIAMGALRAGIPEKELDPLKIAWRKSNPRIVKFWRDCEKAAKLVINGQGKKRIQLNGKLEFSFNRKYQVLQIKLPSGRSLNYFDARIRSNKIEYVKGVRGDGSRFYADTFGGKLVENIVQATARDLLAGALLRIEDAGITTAFHVHDETINIVPRGTTIETINELMTSPAPAWSEGLPLDSEGDVINYYRKV